MSPSEPGHSLKFADVTSQAFLRARRGELPDEQVQGTLGGKPGLKGRSKVKDEAASSSRSKEVGLDGRQAGTSCLC